MKLLLVLLIGLTTIPTFSQIAKKGNSKSLIRILSAQEAGRLERKNVRTIIISYGANLNTEKEISTKEYYEILLKMEKRNSLRQVFQDITEVYRQLSIKEPTRLIKIPSEISVFDCGGCGCARPVAGYASCTGNTCWCACCFN